MTDKFTAGLSQYEREPPCQQSEHSPDWNWNIPTDCFQLSSVKLFPCSYIEHDAQFIYCQFFWRQQEWGVRSLLCFCWARQGREGRLSGTNRELLIQGGLKGPHFPSINNKLQNLNDFFSINGNYFVCSFFFNAPFYGNVSYLASNRNKTLLYPIQDWMVTCSSELVR